jgi:catalase-peroxidase
MFVTDMTMIQDPEYLKISKRFHENQDQFSDAFSRAWFKLTRRDMGPITRYLGKEVPEERLIWQDNVPTRTSNLLNKSEISKFKVLLKNSGLLISQLVETAWASASTYRQTDHRGGANGARIRLRPQKDWPVNKPDQLKHVLSVLGDIASKNDVSIADLIVLGGCVGIEDAAKKGGVDIIVPFCPGRTDASQNETDEESFKYLEPKFDGFRNFSSRNLAEGDFSPESMLLDRTHMLGLTAPEMTVLVAGLRTLFESNIGQFTETPGILNNEWFKNLLSMEFEWKPSKELHIYDGICRKNNNVKWHGSQVDLVFGSNSQLRALCEF